MADPLIVNCYFLFDPFQFVFGDSVRGCVRKDGSAKHPSTFLATDGSFANAFRTRNDVLKLPSKPNLTISPHKSHLTIPYPEQRRHALTMFEMAVRIKSHK